ncbi:hypothetical protein SAMN05428963_110117 [Consotaella salsifontis]|uniref:Uncharacterized protein n=1 Tax=Consotaella salsifontis TaxID=1365950 RepID=A0A1T4SFN6_9HYPH|nr:hypothetical protein SAMN05428963_110117 [Consotaella salsifontis]
MEKQRDHLSALEKVREVMVGERRRLAGHMADSEMRSTSAAGDLLAIQEQIEAIDRAIADETVQLADI